MAIQNEPSRITIPFAASGTKNTIPDTQPSPSASQAASWTDGFPAQCSLPLSAGGIPPARADFNGVFNAITQSERFTQEGGVWLWSNAVDYGASRMVLGSDGKPYWSVAQSGPNVGGAVNPTTDNGTYWVKLPSMADIVAQGFATQGWVTSQGYATQSWVSSQNYATQSWVQNLSAAQVYVDPNGSDSNDGLSAATAVQTFARAVAVGESLHDGKFIVHAASGTYSGDISFNSNTTVYVFADGNITLNGNIDISIYSTLVLTATSSNITVNGYIHAYDSSSVYINCNTVFISVSSSVGVSLALKSSIFIRGILVLTVLSATQAITLYEHSLMYSIGKVYVTVDVTGNAILVFGCSMLVCDSDVAVQSQDSGNDHNYTRATTGLYVSNNSFALMNKLLTPNIFSEAGCIADNCSTIVIQDGGYLHGPKTTSNIPCCLGALHCSTIAVSGSRLDCITHNSNSVAIYSAFGSNITIYSPFLVDTYNYGSGAGDALEVFYCLSGSFLALNTSQTVTILDSVNVKRVFRVANCSDVAILANVNFAGNANSNPNCKKYEISGCSCLELFGRDANTLPGPQAGVTASNGVVV